MKLVIQVLVCATLVCADINNPTDEERKQKEVEPKNEAYLNKLQELHKKKDPRNPLQIHKTTTDDCVVDNGVSYKGTNAKTKKDDPCQNWDHPIYHTIWPYVQTYIKDDKLSRFGNHNFCRNPDNDRSGPWCFTTSPKNVWGYCKGLEKCKPETNADGADCKSTKTGSFYAGETSVSRNAEPCMNWDDIRKEKGKTDKYYNIIPKTAKHNFCRNYDDDIYGPWCFTDKTGDSWSYCNIADCKNEDTSENNIIGTSDELECGKRCMKNGSCDPKPVVSTNVIGGDPAARGEFPWQVQLRTRSGQGYCGGSILNRRWIITAAHCVSEGEEMYVAVGWAESRGFMGDFMHTGSASDLLKMTEEVERGRDLIKVIRWKNHDNYDTPKGTIRYDISILMLERDIKYGTEDKTWSRPACMPTDDYKPKDMNSNILNIKKEGEGEGTNCIISGFGRVDETALHKQGWYPDEDTNGKRLQYVGMDIMASGECYWHRAGFMHTRTGEDSQICIDKKATETKKFTGSCKGDSGGPLTCTPTGKTKDAKGHVDMVQLGLTSFGAGSGCATKPSVYTRLTYHMEWIKDQIKEGENNIEYMSGRQNTGLQFMDKTGNRSEWNWV